jgi:hypothetical protein
MSNNITIGGNSLAPKEFNGQRVITFKDIDLVHQRPDGTAGRNFRQNKEHFIEGEDFYTIKPSNFQTDEIRLSGISANDINNRGTTFITESGYLMLTKSFTDDLSWTVQRELVTTYFNVKHPKAQKSKSNVPKLGEVNAAARIISKTLKEAGMPPQYRAVAIKSLYAPVGVKIPLDGVTTDKRLFDCTAIAKKFGMLSSSGKPHYQAVAAIIAKLPVSESEKELVPFQNQASGHAGPTWQYAQSVVDKVEKWLEEHDWPTSITVGGKTYKVTYQQAV